MATAVGKKFPNLNVDAMNEMGDTFKLNVLEEAGCIGGSYGASIPCTLKELFI